MTLRPAALASLALVAACSPAPFKPPTVAAADAASPLGPSYVLLPLPSEDESLLGRILLEPPPPGRSLEEVSRPNPCLDSLAPEVASPVAATFEDAQDLSVNASARATLGIFGFDADANRASHFVYKISTEKRVARTDTNAYVKCCEKAACGVGFVSALVHGDGEYATGEESGASGSIAVPTAGASGAVQLKVLHRRNVRGYIAALVTITNKQTTTALGPLGVPEGAEPTIPERVRAAYEREKVTIAELPDGTYVLATGTGVLTENEFARRYDEATRTSELAKVDTRRNWGSVIVTGLLTAGFTGAAIWGFSNLKRACKADDPECTTLTDTDPKTGKTLPPPAGSTCTDSGTDGCLFYIPPGKKTTNVAGILIGSTGTALALTTLPFFVISLLHGDGSPTSHALAEDDARAYVTRYNRVVLRRAKEKVDRELTIEKGASLDWHPTLAFGTIGLGASF